MTHRLASSLRPCHMADAGDTSLCMKCSPSLCHNICNILSDVLPCLVWQVGVQTHYADGRGDLILFMGNKSEHALQGVSVSVRPSSSVHAAASAAPPQMLPKQQVQVSDGMLWHVFLCGSGRTAREHAFIK